MNEPESEGQPSSPVVKPRWLIRRWASWSAGVVGMICATIGAVGILIGTENGLELGLVLGGLAAWLLMIWFFLVFVAELEPGDGDGGGVRVNEMVAFCYAFAFFMLGVSALGPIGFFQRIQTTQNMIEADYRRLRPEVRPGTSASEFENLTDKLEAQVITTDTIWPIAILPACVEAPNDASWELSCSRQRRQPDQWIVNIGGYVTNRIPDILQHAKLQYALQGRPAPETLPVSATPSAAPSAQTRNIANKDGAQTVSQQDAQASGVDPAFSDPAMLSGVVYKSIGVYEKWPLFMVHGGLSVPWYVIMLAVMGASVSMMRRVPEYQMQADGAGAEEKAKTQDKSGRAEKKITKGEAREKMVFEVLQLIAAPMIAVVAYNAFTPSDRSGTVLLGFASGFSSEPLLVAIRSWVDRMVTSLKSTGTSSSPPGGGGGGQTGGTAGQAGGGVAAAVAGGAATGGAQNNG